MKIPGRQDPRNRPKETFQLFQFNRQGSRAWGQECDSSWSGSREQSCEPFRPSLGRSTTARGRSCAPLSWQTATGGEPCLIRRFARTMRLHLPSLRDGLSGHGASVSPTPEDCPGAVCMTEAQTVHRGGEAGSWARTRTPASMKSSCS